MSSPAQHSLFLNLFSKTQTRLYAFILMIVHNDNDAEEIFQETSAILWEQFDRFEPGTNFGAWAVSIAKIKVLEYLRQKKKRQAFFNQELYQELSELAEAEFPALDERLKALGGCFQKLDRSCRSLLFLRYQKNLSIGDIAQQKGVSAGVLYRKISKVFNSLRLCVERTMVQWE
jgi:RNA polymerase sigma-70 factor (ECF subfamily)